MRTLGRIFRAALLGWSLLGAASAGQVSIEDAYVRAVPPGQRVTAAYLVAVNHGERPRAIVGAETEAAARAELHTHIHDQGVMRMRPVERVTIPARGRVVFRPGGHHVMLIGLERELKPGDRVALTLILDDGTRIELQPPVRPVQPHGGGSRHDGHGMQHP